MLTRSWGEMAVACVCVCLTTFGQRIRCKQTWSGWSWAARKLVGLVEYRDAFFVEFLEVDGGEEAFDEAFIGDWADMSAFADVVIDRLT